MQDTDSPSAPTPPASFTDSYLYLCSAWRERWSGRPAILGDQYYDLQERGIIVFSSIEPQVSIDTARFAFLPNVDQLLGMLALAGAIPGKENLIFRCEQGAWSVEIHHQLGVTESTRQDSLHGALFHGLIQATAALSFMGKSDSALNRNAN